MFGTTYVSAAGSVFEVGDDALLDALGQPGASGSIVREAAVRVGSVARRTPARRRRGSSASAREQVAALGVRPWPRTASQISCDDLLPVAEHDGVEESASGSGLNAHGPPAMTSGSSLPRSAARSGMPPRSSIASTFV